MRVSGREARLFLNGLAEKFLRFRFTFLEDTDNPEQIESAIFPRRGTQHRL